MSQDPIVKELEGSRSDVPEVPEDLLLWLEHVFAPTCKAPDASLEAHLHHGGHVALVQKLRAIFERQREGDRLVLREDGVLSERPRWGPSVKPDKPRPIN